MAFHNIVFDERYSFGSVGGPKYSTVVVTTTSGFEQRNANWEIPLIVWDISHVLNDSDKIRYVLNFFRNRKGKKNSFLFKDWSDYQVLDSDDAGYNEGLTYLHATNQYKLQKRYYDGLEEELRNIKHVVSGTFKLFNGVTELSSPGDFTFDYATGILSTSAAHTHWTGEFYFEARFDSDELDIRMNLPNNGDWDRIVITEVRS